MPPPDKPYGTNHRYGQKSQINNPSVQPLGALVVHTLRRFGAHRAALAKSSRRHAQQKCTDQQKLFHIIKLEYHGQW